MDWNERVKDKNDEQRNERIIRIFASLSPSPFLLSSSSLPSIQINATVLWLSKMSFSPLLFSSLSISRHIPCHPKGTEDWAGEDSWWAIDSFVLSEYFSNFSSCLSLLFALFWLKAKTVKLRYHPLSLQSIERKGTHFHFFILLSFASFVLIFSSFSPPSFSFYFPCIPLLFIIWKVPSWDELSFFLSVPPESFELRMWGGEEVKWIVVIWISGTETFPGFDSGHEHLILSLLPLEWRFNCSSSSLFSLSTFF